MEPYRTLIGIRCIAQRPTGSRTSEIIGYNKLIKILHDAGKDDLVEVIKSNTRLDYKGRRTFTSGVGYDIVSDDLLGGYDKRNLFWQSTYSIEFVGVSQHGSIKNVSQLYKEEKRLNKSISRMEI